MKTWKTGLSRSSWLAGALLQLGLLGTASVQADYATHPQAQAFVDEMVAEHGFEAAELQGWLTQAERKQSILDAIARPAEKTKPWKDYRKIFLTADRTRKGVAFWQEHRATLERAEKEYGVPASMIVSIIGVETRYGRHKGSYRVMDALSTLAFDYPKRSKFFRKELKHFLVLAREQSQDPLGLKGSYAGAMGYGQFMPSSYREYAVDFDGDGFTDIWNNPVDAIGSVANYFRRHGWQPGEAVVSRARLNNGYDKSLPNATLKPVHTVSKLDKAGFSPLEDYPADASVSIIRLEGDNGAEFWIGRKNFYVITRYNHSRLYAMSVYQLSLAIAEAMAQQAKLERKSASATPKAS